MFPKSYFIRTKRLTNPKKGKKKSLHTYTEAPRELLRIVVSHGNNISASKDKHRNTIFSWNCRVGRHTYSTVSELLGKNLKK